jgi:hypothetical protein
MIDLRHARAVTPTPGPAWRAMSDADRLALVTAKVPARTTGLIIVAAKPDGQIVVSLTAVMPASERGPMLLDLEAHLKNAVDSGLVVWLEPLGDRNSLRNLRGIEVKK